MTNIVQPFAGRVALITGASAGIGEAIAMSLAAAGATVAVTARREERLDALAARISAVGGKALAMAGDIGDAGFATSVVERTVERFGRLDTLVNAAGIMPEGGVETGDLAKWRQAVDVNLLACLHTGRAAISPMRAQGGGDIVNVTSTSGRRATGLFGIYSTTKTALTAFTEGLRQEVGGYGIRVCNIEPGATDTALWENVVDPRLREAIRQRAQREGAMKPEDVAAAVIFVLSLPPRANVSELLIRPTSDTAPL